MADKIHAVIYSPCGGTEKVADALCVNLGEGTIKHNLTLSKNRRQPLSFGKDDFVVFAFPVYGGRMPRNIEKILAKVSGDGTPCALVAVYGNREWEGALLDLNDQVAKRGFIPAGAVAAIAQHSVAPMVAHGRPDNDDREKLADFGAKLFEKMKNRERLDKIPGYYPQWKIPEGVSMFPVTDRDLCVECGECVLVCPCDAIPDDKPYETDDSLCAPCGACVQVCPNDARRLGNDAAQEMAKEHLSHCVERKEPELFV